MSHRDSLARFAVAVMLAVIFVSVSFSAAGIAAPVTDSPAGVSGQAVGQAQSPVTTSQQNASTANAAIVFRNQTTNGTNITIASVTLPKGGFVVIHGPGYARQGIVSGSAITSSRYLAPGTHHNVTIQFSNGVPGAVSNITQFKGAYAPLSAVIYQDTNGNHQFDYVETLQNDTPYQQNGSRVDDQARVVTEEQLDRKTQPTATITFTNQSVTNGTLTVKRASLPKGGFVVVHDARYLRGGDPFKSAIGLSGYLSPGTHQNISVALVNGTVQQNQTLVAVAYRDTNSNRTYDYVRGNGMADYGYVNRSGPNATIVTNTAYVSVSSPTATPTPTQTPSPTTADAPRASVTQTSPTTDRPSTADSASGGMLSDVPLWLEIGLLIIFALIAVQLIIRWR
jgi:hypothetical protein